MQLKEIPYRINQFLKKKIDKNILPDNFSDPVNGNFSKDICEYFEKKNGKISRLNKINNEINTCKGVSKLLEAVSKF